MKRFPKGCLTSNRNFYRIIYSTLSWQVVSLEKRRSGNEWLLDKGGGFESCSKPGNYLYVIFPVALWPHSYLSCLNCLLLKTTAIITFNKVMRLWVGQWTRTVPEDSTSPYRIPCCPDRCDQARQPLHLHLQHPGTFQWMVTECSHPWRLVIKNTITEHKCAWITVNQGQSGPHSLLQKLFW